MIEKLSHFHKNSERNLVNFFHLFELIQAMMDSERPIVVSSVYTKYEQRVNLTQLQSGFVCFPFFLRANRRKQIRWHLNFRATG